MLLNVKNKKKLLFLPIVFGLLLALANQGLYAQNRQDSLQQFLNNFYAFKEAQNYQKALQAINKVVNYYADENNYELALKYYKESIPVNQELNNRKNLKKIYSNIAVLYINLQQPEEALPYFERSLAIKQDMNRKKEIVAGLYDVAYTHGLLGEYQKGVDKLLDALGSARKNNYTKLSLSIYKLLTRFYENMGDIASAEKYQQEYNQYSRYVEEQQYRSQVEKLREESQVAERRMALERKERRLEAKEEQLKRDSLNRIAERQADSMARSERREELLQEKIAMEQRAKQKEIEARKQEKQARIAEEKARKRTSYIMAVLLAAAIIVGIIIAINYRIRKKANEELSRKNEEISNKNEALTSAFNKIEEKNVQIMQGINYAQTIQEAMIPERAALQKYIPESFVFYKPLENVSGDFYWFNEVELEKDRHEEHADFLIRMKSNGQDKSFLPIENNKFIVSAIDCTGHGVPGAFMSMIGNNLMFEAVNNGISKPDMILDFLNNGVRRSLNQDKTENKDGMDMSLCVINKYERKVEFASANNPMIYIQDDEVKTIHGDRKPVGGIQVDVHKSFSRHEITVDRPTCFYIFSDGYVDQFGGPRGRKMMLKNFAKILQKIYKEPMQKQAQLLDEHFEEWKGDKEKQIDDVLVIGFKLDGSSGNDD